MSAAPSSAAAVPAITRALNELGIPNRGTPAPVASAIAILALERHVLLGHELPFYECRHELCRPYSP